MKAKMRYFFGRFWWWGWKFDVRGGGESKKMEFVVFFSAQLEKSVRLALKGSCVSQVTPHVTTLRVTTTDAETPWSPLSIYNMAYRSKIIRNTTYCESTSLYPPMLQSVDIQ